MAGFPLPNTAYYFTISESSKRTRIEIYNGSVAIVRVEASNKRIALERAWNALQEWCMRGHRSAQQGHAVDAPQAAQ